MGPRYTIHEDEVSKIQLVGRVVSPLITSDMGAQNILLSSGVYESGRSLPPHKHDQEEEALYVISGHGEIKIGDLVESLRPGSAVYIPPGIKHYLTVNSDEPMRLIFIFSPPAYPGSYPEDSPE